MNTSQATALRDIALRMELGSDPYVIRLDAAVLRAIADEVDEAARPRSQREIEGDRKRAASGLWPAFRRIWGRTA